MPTFTNLDIEESATVTARVASVQIARGSTNEEQEILCLGDPDTSNAIAAVTASAPASTRWGLNVRIAGGPSSVADLAVRAVLPSTYGDHGLRVLQSSAADLNVTVAGYSTTVNVSSVAGAVIVRSSAADAIVTVKNSTIGELLASVQQNSTTWAVQIPTSQSVQAKNSTIGDLLASVQQNSTVWFTQTMLRTSSGGNLEGSSVGVAQGVLGLHVRQAPSSIQTVGVSTAGATSTNTELVSSQANPISVWSYSITSTVIAASTISFRSSLGAVIWPLVLGTGSSGITGANLSANPPDPLFRTVANTALTFHVPTAGAEYHIAVRYST